jgi:pyrroline-5-carboxylate reductase
MAERELRLGFIGAGNMAAALVRGLLAQGTVSAGSVWVASPSGPRRAIAETGVHCTKDNAEVCRHADVLILAVKPYVMSSALESIRGALKPSTLIISVAAGISIAQLTAMLSAGPSGSAWRIIRVMPNTPAAIGHGASAICLGGFAKPSDAELASRLFQAVGTVEVVGEAMMDGAWRSREAAGLLHPSRRTARGHQTFTPHPSNTHNALTCSCHWAVWLWPRLCVHVY